MKDTPAPHQLWFHDSDISKLIVRLTCGGLLILHGSHSAIHGIQHVKDMVARAGLPEFIAYGNLIGEVVAPLFLIALGIHFSPRVEKPGLVALTVGIRIDTSGNVTATDLLRSSGNSACDQAAQTWANMSMPADMIEYHGIRLGRSDYHWFMEAGSPAAKLVENFKWTNADPNVVAGYIAQDGMSPEAAAEKWVKANQDKVQEWLPQS